MEKSIIRSKHSTRNGVILGQDVPNFIKFLVSAIRFFVVYISYISLYPHPQLLINTPHYGPKDLV